MTRDHELEAAALQVLADNWTGRWTRPSQRLYPHLWSWDSALVALGKRRHRPDEARIELEAVMEGQWESGMVPHIRFDPTVTGEYFPGPETWRTEGLAGGPPAGLATSGIMQPPVHAMAALALAEVGIPISGELFTRLYQWHRYLMTARDPQGCGGITIVHPWESGLDNSPRWDGPLLGYPLPRRPEYVRVDTERVADPAERPPDAYYDRYVDLLERLRAVGYQVEQLPADYPFKVKDVLTTAIFAAANRDLLTLARRLGRNLEAEVLLGYQVRVLDGFDRLFGWPGARAARRWYVDRCERTGELLEVLTVAGAGAVLAEVPAIADPEEWLRFFADGALRVPGSSCPRLLPSTAPDEAAYDPICYWRGPGWIVTQWLVTRGLGPESLLGRELRAEALALLSRQGFREYFDPRDGTGRGAENFSWSAALALDWMAG